MKRIRQRLGVIQNEGFYDRVLRMAAGFALLGWVAYDLTRADATFQTWHAVAALLAVYPILTGMLGWCPLYQLLGVRSCKEERCGTLPYEFETEVLHHKLEPASEVDHSLAGSRHVEPQEEARPDRQEEGQAQRPRQAA